GGLGGEVRARRSAHQRRGQRHGDRRNPKQHSHGSHGVPLLRWRAEIKLHSNRLCLDKQETWCRAVSFCYAPRKFALAAAAVIITSAVRKRTRFENERGSKTSAVRNCVTCGRPLYCTQVGRRLRGPLTLRQQGSVSSRRCHGQPREAFRGKDG